MGYITAKKQLWIRFTAGEEGIDFCLDKGDRIWINAKHEKQFRKSIRPYTNDLEVEITATGLTSGLVFNKPYIKRKSRR